MSEHESQRFAYNHNLFARAHGWDRCRNNKPMRDWRRGKNHKRFDWMNP